MKGDRFEKMIGVFYRTRDCGCVECTKEDITTLLRKEHAAVRRVVKKFIKETCVCSEPQHQANVTYRLACNDILAALDRRAKGGTK